MSDVVLTTTETKVTVTATTPDTVTLTTSETPVTLTLHPGPIAWGTVVGALAEQGDLQAALEAKQATLGYVPLDPADNLAALANATTARANLGAQRALGWIHAGDYGVVGDGTTDNTTALQNAINAAVNASHPLYLPAGQYLTGNLTASGALHLVGDGVRAGVGNLVNRTTLLAAPGTTTLLTLAGAPSGQYLFSSILDGLTLDGQHVAGTVLLLGDRADIYAHFRHLRITNGVNYGVATVSATAGHYINQWEHVQIDHCGIGLSLRGAFQDVLFTHCEFSYCTSKQVELIGNAVDVNDGVVFQTCDFEGNSGATSGIELTNANSLLFEGCYFETQFNSATRQIRVLGVSGSFSGITCQECRFYGFDSNQYHIKLPPATDPGTTRLLLLGGNMGHSTVGTVENAGNAANRVDAWAVRGMTDQMTGLTEVTLEDRLTGTASVATNVLTPGRIVPRAATLKELAVRCGTAPTGAALVAVANLDGSAIGTVTVPSGQLQAATAVSQAMTAGQNLTWNITKVGSVTPGANLSFVATTVPTLLPIVTAPLVSDTFLGADNTAISSHPADSGQAWTEHVAGLVILSNQLVAPSGFSGAFATLDAGVANGTFQVDMTRVTNTPRFVFRCQDSSNYLHVGVFTSSIQISKNVGGVFTTLASASFTMSTGTLYTFAVVANGTSIVVKVNGTTAVSVTTSQFQTATRVGLRYVETNVVADNLLVTA